MTRVTAFVIAAALIAPVAIPLGAHGNAVVVLPLTAERRFTANDLYGHINGGAELFLEFGFKDLVIHEYAHGTDKVAVEVYRMSTPEGALGVYLMKVGKETPHPDLPVRNSYGRYQITALKGNRFILANNFSGEERLVDTALSKLARALLDIENADAPPILESLPQENRVEGSERLVCGPYSLQNLYTLGRGDVLLLGGTVYGAAARYRGGGDKPFTRIRIAYPDEKRAVEAFAHLIDHLDPLHVIIDRSKSSLVFRDHREFYGAVRRRGKVVELDLKLESPPAGPRD